MYTFCFFFFYACKYVVPPNKRPPPACGVAGAPRNDEDIKNPSDREARTENPFLSG